MCLRKKFSTKSSLWNEFHFEKDEDWWLASIGFGINNCFIILTYFIYFMFSLDKILMLLFSRKFLNRLHPNTSAWIAFNQPLQLRNHFLCKKIIMIKQIELVKIWKFTIANFLFNFQLINHLLIFFPLWLYLIKPLIIYLIINQLFKNINWT